MNEKKEAFCYSLINKVNDQQALNQLLKQAFTINKNNPISVFRKNEFKTELAKLLKPEYQIELDALVSKYWIIIDELNL